MSGLTTKERVAVSDRLIAWHKAHAIKFIADGELSIAAAHLRLAQEFETIKDQIAKGERL